MRYSFTHSTRSITSIRSHWWMVNCQMSGIFTRSLREGNMWYKVVLTCGALCTYLCIWVKWQEMNWKVLHQCWNPRDWSTSHIKRITAPLTANWRQPRLSKSSLAMVNFWFTARSQLQILTSNVTFIITNLGNKRWRHYKKVITCLAVYSLSNIIFLFHYIHLTGNSFVKLLYLRNRVDPSNYGLIKPLFLFGKV